MRRLLNRLIPRSIQLYRLEQRERRRSINGLPDGISKEILQELCKKVLHSYIKDVSHIHLSGWKQSGAYRLLLRLDNGTESSLIYKVACYGYEDIPALHGLPIQPGLPEFIVFNLENGPVREFLPAVYWSEKNESERIYRYICEDLGTNHYLMSRSPDEKRDILFVAERLPAVQHALERSLEADRKKQLLQFDQAYSMALMKYAQTSLDAYEKKTSDSVVRNVMNNLNEVERIYLQDEFFDNRPAAFIHGDFNTSNIYISKNGNGLKVVDWEWAGYGVPHADLVSLLKGCSLKTQDEAIELFGRGFKGLSMQEHKRWFHWCRLERGLLDAAFLARQQLESNRRVEWIPDRIRQRINGVLEDCRELS